MASYTIAVLPGDGIGPEVISQARRVLEVVSGLYGFELSFQDGLIGQAAQDQTGRMLPPETVRICREADAVLLGPVGGSRWEHPEGTHHPKQAVMSLRGWLGTYVTLRPIRFYPTLASFSPLKPELRGFELLVVYDHASGLYYGTPRGIETTEKGLVAVNTQVYSQGEIDRVAVVACQEACQRKHTVTSVDQSKVLETGQLWRDRVEEVAKGFPEVTLTRLDADNFFFHLVSSPTQYDLVLANSVLGELISVTAAGLTGSYAIHPAAYLGANCVGLFQAAHGAAEGLAGKNVANPIGAIRAAAMLLEDRLSQRAAAMAVEAAIEEALAEGNLPADVCPKAMTPKGTQEMGDAVIAALRRHVPAQAGVKG